MITENLIDKVLLNSKDIKDIKNTLSSLGGGGTGGTGDTSGTSAGYKSFYSLEEVLNEYGLDKRDYSMEELFLALPSNSKIGICHNKVSEAYKITDTPTGNYFYLEITKSVNKNYNTVYSYSISDNKIFLWRYHNTSIYCKKWEEIIKDEKTKSLSASSTDNQIPTAKAVYDAIQAVGGGGNAVGGSNVQLNKIIFIDQEPDYNVNDISAVLNRLIPTIDEGDVLYLKAETVFLEGTVRGTLPRGATLYLDASIELTRLVDAFSLSLGVYGGGRLYIKELTNFLINNYANLSNVGLTLYETYNAEITFDIIQGFKYGLYLDGGKSENGYKGIQYNKIHFLNMNRCNTDIYLNAQNSTGWVNNNTFTGGRLMGKVAIATAPIGNVDVYNNNKFYDIGFEGVTDSIIQFNNARYNCVMNPRILEDFPNDTWVYEDEYCIANQYHISHPVPENKFELGWHSEVHAQLLYGDSWDFNLIMSRRMYVEYSVGRNENVKMYDDIAHSLHIDDTTFANSGNKYHVKQKTNIYVKLNNSSSSNTRYLIIDKCFNYHGCTFDIYVTNASGNYLSFGYYDNSNSIVLGTNIVGNGVYRLTNYEGLWVFSKISEEFKMI